MSVTHPACSHSQSWSEMLSESFCRLMDVYRYKGATRGHSGLWVIFATSFSQIHLRTGTFACCQKSLMLLEKTFGSTEMFIFTSAKMVLKPSIDSCWTIFPQIHDSPLSSVKPGQFTAWCMLSSPSKYLLSAGCSNGHSRTRSKDSQQSLPISNTAVEPNESLQTTEELSQNCFRRVS